MCYECEEKIVKLTKEEFLKFYPPRTRTIKINGVIVAILGTEFVCDLCNAEVYTDENPYGYGLFVGDSKYPCDLICKDCYERVKDRF